MKGFGKKFVNAVREEDREWMELYHERSIDRCRAKLKKMELKAKRDLQDRVF